MRPRRAADTVRIERLSKSDVEWQCCYLEMVRVDVNVRASIWCGWLCSLGVQGGPVRSLLRCLPFDAAPCSCARAGCSYPPAMCRGGRRARPAFARARRVAVRTASLAPLPPCAALRWADEEGNATAVAGTRALHARGRAVRVQAMEEERDEMVLAELPVAVAEVSFEAEAAQEAAAPALPFARAFVAGASGGVGSKLVGEVRAETPVPERAGLHPQSRHSRAGRPRFIATNTRCVETPTPSVGWATLQLPGPQ